VRRALLLAGAAGALLLGVAALALAASVRAVPSALRQEDAAIASPRPGAKIGPRSTGERLARTAVGAPDRRAYFQILTHYAATVGNADFTDPSKSVDEVQGNHGANELRIAGLLARLHDPRERSQAATMLGTLILLYSSNGQAIGGGQLLQQALANYQSAVRSDSSNEAAKYDLELLLSLHSSHKRQRSQTQRTKPSEQGRGGRPATVKGNDY
jgi:hypothetical protein